MYTYPHHKWNSQKVSHPVTTSDKFISPKILPWYGCTYKLKTTNKAHKWQENGIVSKCTNKQGQRSKYHKVPLLWNLKVLNCGWAFRDTFDLWPWELLCPQWLLLMGDVLRFRVWSNFVREVISLWMSISPLEPSIFLQQIPNL